MLNSNKPNQKIYRIMDVKFTHCLHEIRQIMLVLNPPNHTCGKSATLCLYNYKNNA
jgi:hypothetical protein